MAEDYRSLNRANWDERAPAHAASPDYAVASFREDPDHLSDVVRFDLPRLGELRGLRGVHLQCHIGTDTVSLARLGAEMCGLDFSSRSIAEARALAGDLGLDIEFVESDLYAAVEALKGRRFDLVYTGIGAICWLPDIDRWAGVVAELLAPGGRLFMREGHPMLWAMEDGRPDDLLVARYPYFEREEPDVFTEEGTYVETAAKFTANTTHTWNHGIGELLSALLAKGLRITSFEEHDSVPWDALPGQMEKLELGEYRLRERFWRLAHSYTVQALKDG
ncbi:MAG: class I SAM-dependent methyltransferase [Solirubrobacterales bacterium]|nr:class I SAM-dependent methyltransferase [Solirubrobacterales bacterium]